MPRDLDTYPLVEPNRTELEPWRKQLLDAAKEVRKGWCRGALSRDGNVCAIGAIMVADGAERDPVVIFRHRESGACLEAMAALETIINMPIPSWNNCHAKDSEEVASTMERVALSGRRAE